MSGYETSALASQLIQSTGCYFGIFDYASSVNRPGKWDDLFRAARRRAGRQQWSALFYLNQSWIDLADEGALLSWITLFDGVFKIEVRLLPEDGQIDFRDEGRLLGERKKNLWYCPSGAIAADSLTRLGSSSVNPLMYIEPGTYRVGFIGNGDEESKHQFLEDVSQYPAHEGPDW